MPHLNNIDSSANEANGTQLSVVVCDKDARIPKKSSVEADRTQSNVGAKKTSKTRRHRTPESQSQTNVSPAQVLTTDKTVGAKKTHTSRQRGSDS